MKTLLKRTTALAALCAVMVGASSIASADGYGNSGRDDHGVSNYRDDRSHETFIQQLANQIFGSHHHRDRDRERWLCERRARERAWREEQLREEQAREREARDWNRNDDSNWNNDRGGDNNRGQGNHRGQGRGDNGHGRGRSGDNNHGG